MFTITNDEINKLSPIKTEALCRDCGEMHEVKYGETVLEDGSKVKSDLLAFITCPETEKSYLVGIDGRKLDFNKR